MTAGDLELVRERELAMMDPEVRRDTAALEDLLHHDFVEFGSSGRSWTRAELIDALIGEASMDPPEVRDLAAHWVGAGTVLVTYTTMRDTRETLRSSLWVNDGGKWQIVFHQGTVRPEAV